MEARKLVGWNVRRLRVAKGLTIEELAGRADTDSSFVARLERGQVNVGILKLEKLSRVLEAKLADLVVEPPQGAKPPRPLPAGRRANSKSIAKS